MGLQYTPYCFLCNMLCGGGVNTTDAQIVMWISFKAPILVQYVVIFLFQKPTNMKMAQWLGSNNMSQISELNKRYICPNVKVTSNKNVHNFWHHFLALFYIPFYGIVLNNTFVDALVWTISFWVSASFK